MDDKDCHHDWFKKRNYIHFDNPLSLKNAIKLVTNPEIITKHSFLPFIKDIIFDKKIKKKDGQIAKNDKDREVFYASHADSHIYSYYSKIISEEYERYLSENNLSDCVLAFLKKPKENSDKNKCNIDFAFQTFQEISNLTECIVLVIDITGFFDHLDHDILKKNWIVSLRQSRVTIKIS